MSIVEDTVMSTAEPAVASRPTVWIIYHDKMKNVESAEKYGILKEMFTGYVDYSTAVDLTLKMLKGRYRPGDYLLEMGQPRLVAIVTTVAEKYFSADGAINMLCWNKREQEYFPQTFHFPDEDQPMQVPESMEGRAPSSDGERKWDEGGELKYVIARADGTEAQPGIYDWRIIHPDGTQSCYIGRFTYASRFKSYERNVNRLLNSLPYRPSNPTGFRKVHHHLAAAVRDCLRVERRIVENCPTDRLNEREQHWIARRRAEGLLMLNG